MSELILVVAEETRALGERTGRASKTRRKQPGWVKNDNISVMGNRITARESGHATLLMI